MMRLQREGQAFGAKPEPDAAGRAEFGKAIEDGADGGRDSLVGMETNLTIGVTPDEAYGQAAAQLAAGRLVADATVEPGAQDVEFGFAHGALQAEKQAVVEQARVIDAVGVADQGIGETAEIEETIPVGIVAGEPGDLETEHDADLPEGDLGGEPGEAAARSKSGAGDAEILVDDGDLLACPAELGGAGDQGVLPRGRFTIELDLGLAGLAEVDAGGAPEMPRLDLGELSHHAAPPVFRPGPFGRAAAPALRWRWSVPRDRSGPTDWWAARDRRETPGSVARELSSSAAAGGPSRTGTRRSRRALTTARARNSSARVPRLRGATVVASTATGCCPAAKSVHSAGMSERLPSGRISSRRKPSRRICPMTSKALPSKA